MQLTTNPWLGHTTNWRAAAMTASLLLLLVGCSGAPSRVAAPEWEPEQIADQAIATLDKDGDGLLSTRELAAAPGLKYCADQLDQDGDQQLTRDEIRDRIKLYEDLRVGYTTFMCRVLYKGRPLPGALVKLIPEPFLGSIVEPAQGTTGRSGQVQLVAESSDMPVMRIGMYRVEITSSRVKIPEKYNKLSTLGVEVSGVTDPNGQPVFMLKSR
ncbi:MAG: hypothetical protein ABGX16_11635 [Pirellulales bacterium]